MKLRIAWIAAWLGCLPAWAGEIVIIQSPDGGQRNVREPSRSERELGRTVDKAREYAGTANGPVIVEERSGSRAEQNAEQSMRDATDYLRPASGAAASTGGTTIILRAAPGEPEKLRQKARSYNAPDGGGRTAAPCGEVANAVGTIGGVTGANVIEKGNSAVIVNCK